MKHINWSKYALLVATAFCLGFFLGPHIGWMAIVIAGLIALVAAKTGWIYD